MKQGARTKTNGTGVLLPSCEALGGLLVDGKMTEREINAVAVLGFEGAHSGARRLRFWGKVEARAAA
jgi:hypothetical protein